MVAFTFQDLLTDGPASYMTGISDLDIRMSPSGPLLYVSSGPDGGISCYRVTATGAQFLERDAFQPGQIQAVTGQTEQISLDGQDLLVTLGRHDTTPQCFDLNAAGQITGTAELTATGGFSAAIVSMKQVTVAGQDYLYASHFGLNGFAIYEAGPGGQLQQIGQAGGTGTGPQSADLIAMHSLDIGANSYLLTLSAAEDALVSYRLGSDGMATETGRADASTGLAISDATALAEAVVDGAQYLVVAAAGSSSLSVLRMGPDGALFPTDHVLDDLNTRFADVQALEAVSIGGRSFLVAGGGDDGLSLFTLLPGGRLLHLGQIANGPDTGLSSIQALALTVEAGVIHVFASSQADQGVTHLTVDPGPLGDIIHSDPGGATVSGTAAGDVLIGGDGNDKLRGQDGDDILIDGGGYDNLRGGAGADIFVFTPDGLRDKVEDFELGIDRLDLSAYGRIYSLAQLSISSTSWGAKIFAGDEEIRLYSMDGLPIDPAAFRIGDLVDLAHFPIQVPSSDDALSGSTGDDTLMGYEGDDTLSGLEGDDSLLGGTGDDLLDGGDGNDSLYGDAGQDTVTGGGGDDLLDGASGNDTLLGQAGDDSLLGAAGTDVLNGDAGRDTLRGGGDADVLRGGADEDLMFGDTGNDVLMGDASDDTLFGGAGDDLLDGGDQADNLLGQDGDDTALGGDGNDTIDGGAGDDTLLGQDGDDSLLGVAGTDVLNGDAGNDTLRGGGDADVLRGGAQEDLLFGDTGNDTLSGDAGFDTLLGGAGDDVLDGGGQADNLAGQGGDDVLLGQGGHDTMDGGDGDDILLGQGGNDSLLGGTGNDVLNGDAGNDRAHGGDGDDMLRGGNQEDRLYGDAGDDTLLGGPGFDRLEGGDGDDRLDGGGQADNLLGGTGNDTLLGGAGFDRLFGGDGGDLAYGGGGPDALFGQAGNDSLYAQGGNDRIFGGTGNDLIDGGTGDDAMSGGAGFDTLIGSTGNDRLTGAFNADTFVFADFGGGFGQDTITDFDAASTFERIDLARVGAIADFADLAANHMSQIGATVLINAGGGDTITLLNTSMGDLDATDFIF